MAEEKHTHTAPDGTVYEHVHGQEAHTHSHAGGHAHGHAHSHANTRAVLNRLSRAIGHLDCSEVLIQLSAVKSAINNTGKVILKDHIEHCLVEAVECGDMESIADLTQAIDRFMK